MTTTTTGHPRRYRVGRFEPGLTWAEWTYSYHPTIEGARKAAENYLYGRGRRYSFGAMRRGPSRRYAIIAERRQAWGRVFHDEVERHERTTPAEAVAP